MGLSPALSSYLSKVQFNVNGPLIMPIATERGAAPMTTRGVVGLARTAYQEASGDEYTESAAGKIEEKGRKLIANFDEFGGAMAVLTAGSPRAVELRQELTVNRNGSDSGYELKISVPLLRTLAEAAALTVSDDARLSDAEFALALALRIYVESLPEDVRAARLPAMQGSHHLSPSEELGLSSNGRLARFHKTVVSFVDEDVLLNIPGSQLYALRARMPSFDAILTGEGSAASLALGYSVDPARHDVAPTFAKLFDLASRIVALDIDFTKPKDEPVGGPPV